MTDKLISNIAFMEDAVVIEYIEVSDLPIQRSISMVIPAEFVEKADLQLQQDFQELIADANTLLDSANLAYHGAASRLQEMGRT